MKTFGFQKRGTAYLKLPDDPMYDKNNVDNLLTKKNLTVSYMKKDALIDSLSFTANIPFVKLRQKNNDDKKVKTQPLVNTKTLQKMMSSNISGGIPKLKKEKSNMNLTNCRNLVQTNSVQTDFLFKVSKQLKENKLVKLNQSSEKKDSENQSLINQNEIIFRQSNTTLSTFGMNDYIGKDFININEEELVLSKNTTSEKDLVVIKEKDEDKPSDILEFKKHSIVEEYAILLEQNAKTRDHMEDYLRCIINFMEDPEKNLYVLCDGHCGDQPAKIVIDRLPLIFEDLLRKYDFEVEKAITDSFSLMDEELVEFEETGTTCCLIYICIENSKRVVYSGNVGDSRNILVRRDQTIRLSFDHKANVKSEIERVKKEGGLIIRGRLYGTLAITRALGDYSFKNDVNGLSNIPYITRTEILDDDRYIIMASDGIWDVINEETSTILCDGSKLKDAASISSIFVSKSLEFGSKDNISCIVVKLN